MSWIMDTQLDIFLCRLERAKAIQSQHIFLYLLWKFSLFRFAAMTTSMVSGMNLSYQHLLMMFHIFLKTDSVKELLKLLEQSSQFTSPKVNYEVRNLWYWFQKRGHRGILTVQNSKSYKRSVKILGCHHSYNSQLANDRNFCDTIKRFQMY